MLEVRLEQAISPSPVRPAGFGLGLFEEASWPPAARAGPTASSLYDVPPNVIVPANPSLVAVEDDGPPYLLDPKTRQTWPLTTVCFQNLPDQTGTSSLLRDLLSFEDGQFFGAFDYLYVPIRVVDHPSSSWKGGGRHIARSNNMAFLNFLTAEKAGLFMKKFNELSAAYWFGEKNRGFYRAGDWADHFLRSQDKHHVTSRPVVKWARAGSSYGQEGTWSQGLHAQLLGILSKPTTRRIRNPDYQPQLVRLVHSENLCPELILIPVVSVILREATWDDMGRAGGVAHIAALPMFLTHSDPLVAARTVLPRTMVFGDSASTSKTWKRDGELDWGKMGLVRVGGLGGGGTREVEGRTTTEEVRGSCGRYAMEVQQWLRWSGLQEAMCHVGSPRLDLPRSAPVGAKIAKNESWAERGRSLSDSSGETKAPLLAPGGTTRENRRDGGHEQQAVPEQQVTTADGDWGNGNERGARGASGSLSPGSVKMSGEVEERRKNEGTAWERSVRRFTATGIAHTAVVLQQGDSSGYLQSSGVVVGGVADARADVVGTPEEPTVMGTSSSDPQVVGSTDAGLTPRSHGVAWQDTLHAYCANVGARIQADSRDYWFPIVQQPAHHVDFQALMMLANLLPAPTTTPFARLPVEVPPTNTGATLQQEMGTGSLTPPTGEDTSIFPAPDYSPRVEDSDSEVNASLASVGSAEHESGNCRPCAFFGKKAGCTNGANCEFCHRGPGDDPKHTPKGRRKEMLLKMGGNNHQTIPAPDYSPKVYTPRTPPDNPQLELRTVGGSSQGGSSQEAKGSKRIFTLTWIFRRTGTTGPTRHDHDTHKHPRKHSRKHLICTSPVRNMFFRCMS